MDDIARLENYMIGNAQQWLLFSGSSSSKPALLFLHGGPGLPLFPMRRSLKEHTVLEELFTVVYWEQRGTGKSFDSDIPSSSMSIEQFVMDAIEVAGVVCDELGIDHLLLLGHSWGSIIGTLAASRSPELFSAYVGIGQIVHMLEGERRSYEWVRQQAQEASHEKACRDLEAIGHPPHSVQDHLTERRWVQEFGGGRRDKSTSVFNTLIEAFRTPQYNFLDVFRMVRYPYFSLEHLLDEMYGINFFERVPRLELPVYFVAGRHDHTVPAELVQEYHTRLEAPAKQLYWFDNSAHYPFFEEPRKFDGFLQELVDAT